MKHIFTFIGFILLCLTGIAGIPSWPKPETSIGYYKISKNPYGVAIYQDGKHADVQFVDATGFSVKGRVITIDALSKIVYSRDDIIFDATAIYTDPPQEQIDYLRMKKVSTVTLPEAIYLVNPHIPGMLELRGSNMHIDINQKQIEGSIKTIIVHDTVNI